MKRLRKMSRRSVLALTAGLLAIAIAGTGVVAQVKPEVPLGPYARHAGESDQAYQARLERDFGIRLPGPFPKFTAPPEATAMPVPYDTSLPQIEYPRYDSPEQRAKEFVFARDTRGKEVEIAGRKVQLPPDAYITGQWDLFCVTSSCDSPVYEIVRGDSSIAVSVQTGKLSGERTGPGDEHAFDFLKEALSR